MVFADPAVLRGAFADVAVVEELGRISGALERETARIAAVEEGLRRAAEALARDDGTAPPAEGGPAAE